MAVCSVPSCTSRKKKKGTNALSFHEFPCDYVRRSKWEEEIFRHTLVPMLNKEAPLICSLHFTENDYLKYENKRLLKKTAVPSVFEVVPGVTPLNYEISNDGKNNIQSIYIEDQRCSSGDGLKSSTFVEESEDILYCRLCAKVDEDCIPIFEAEGKEMELNMKILKYLPINISESDSLPDLICPYCVSAVNAWHEFAENCLTAEIKLLEIFPAQELKITVLKEENCEVVTMMPDNIIVENQELSNNQDILNIIINGDVPNVLDDVKVSDGSINEDNDCNIVSEYNDPLADRKTFPCNLCNQEFTTLQFYYQHKRRMHSSGTYKCNLCSLVFNENCSLLTHKISQHNYASKLLNKKKLCVCPVCNKQVFNHEYRKHLASHNDLGYCPVCYTQLLKRDLRKHLRTHDNVCKQCFQIFSDSEQYNLHKKVHCFLCETCGKNLNSKEAFIRHLTLHVPNNDLMKCDECDKAFRHKKNLKIHIECKHLKQKMICEKCGAEFDTIATYKKHIRAGHPVKCGLCGKVIKNERCFNKHVSVCDTSFAAKSLKCKYCDKTFISEYTLQGHINYKHVLRKTTCEKCGKIFDTVAACKAHLQGTHGRRFKCNMCNRIYSCENRLNKHMKIHRVPFEAQPLTCMECNKTFKNKSSLNEHMNSKHLIQNTICDACGSKFRSVLAYKKHYRQSHSKPRPFKCNLCIKDFLTEHSLAFHMNIHHSKTVQCKECGFFAKNYYSLQHHMRTHKPENVETSEPNTETCKPKVRTYDPNKPRKPKTCKPKICDICGITTSTMYLHKLRDHKMYRNKCRFCDKTYMGRKDKESHERAKHTGERIFECHLCGKSFFSKSILDSHSQTHSTTLNFTCQYCKRKFHTRNNRNDHRRRCPYKTDTNSLDG